MPARRLRTCERGLAALEFALLAPALLMLVFAVVLYSFYFAALMGVRHAAVEGARAAVAGLSTTERTALAQGRAQAVIGGYGTLLAAGGGPVVTAGPDATGTFRVRVSYDMSGSPMMRYAAFIPMPSPTVSASIVVTNGSY
ncbi:pilus assembly protein [Sphingobium indicum]|uniref:Pilus assembly protein TadE n=2 Tax=Sphingobium indicum TaxID=332055 RepID=A0A1L5BUN7_SPHIB|nr:TadE/TadG family type IV pilus assembly protein [Sphingobium indicum]APL96561.1 pilus assembly protein TadE [Sphingobium indicum B90A]KEY97948.1 pilus assembly protein TadE [Sphingomonas sp. BHC-A]NYI23753.1 Flp pilus assembly protein TadG [Sphingobium indicum]RYM00390.1 pilus assembly protein [Sphingobium indicum]